ncbi:MAG TPA: lipopolysaccharide assembly protein LapA domain-containing protein [Acidimicrobiales bacterium]|nr:lipopolysaccharide assembly protein LapA domain-containing protein [Acidimicrobiales bacterium]
MTDTKGLPVSDIVSDGNSQAPRGPEGAPTTSVGARQPRVTRLGNAHAGLIAAAVVLVLLLVFILENAHSVNVGFLGAHLQLPLSVALLLAGVGGALLVGAVGAGRIAQLRRAVHREAHRFDQPR